MKGIWTYQKFLKTIPESDQITLGEGHTPLIKSKYISKILGIKNLYFKLENLNPTGSYKDRFAAMAISQLKIEKNTFCIATSSGNTGAALAAYSAAGQIQCFIAIVDGAPQNKLQQMQLYGATTLMVKDFGKSTITTNQVMNSLNDLAVENNTKVQISAYSYCPDAMEAVQTISYEIAEVLNEPIDIFVPAGGGGLTLAVARGFEIWEKNKQKEVFSRVHCVQPIGNDTIATAINNRSNSANSIPSSKTLISGLQVPNILDGNEVVRQCKKFAGTGVIVSDQSIFKYQELLANKEGIYCEPAAAVSLAGLAKAIEGRTINLDRPIVCVITGHGFKDMDSSSNIAKMSKNAYLNDTEELRNYIQSSIKY